MLLEDLTQKITNMQIIFKCGRKLEPATREASDDVEQRMVSGGTFWMGGVHDEFHSCSIMFCGGGCCSSDWDEGSVVG
jgi:hypothetical protein